MAKKKRFPLIMGDGIEVKDLDSLRENFSILNVLNYLENGELETWLRDRYEDDMAEEISLLSKATPNIEDRLFEIFGIEHEEVNEQDVKRQERIEKLKKFTSDDEYIRQIDFVAFDQDELYDLLDENIKKIFLCGDKFSVPSSKKNMTYLGINQPEVTINLKKDCNINDLNIVLENVKRSQMNMNGVNPNVPCDSLGGDLDKDFDEEDRQEAELFISEMKEKMEEFLEEIKAYTYDDFFKDSPGIDVDDLDIFDIEDDSYGSMAAARKACKSALEDAIEEFEKAFDSEKDTYVMWIEDEFEEFVDSVVEHVQKLVDAFVEFVDVKDAKASGVSELLEYIFQKKLSNSNLISKNVYDKIIATEMNGLFDVAKQQAVKTVFDDQIGDLFSKTKYFDLCDIDEVDDDEYGYNLEDALDALSSNTMDFFGYEGTKLPDQLFEKYFAVTNVIIDRARNGLEKVIL